MVIVVTLPRLSHACFCFVLDVQRSYLHCRLASFFLIPPRIRSLRGNWSPVQYPFQIGLDGGVDYSPPSHLSLSASCSTAIVILDSFQFQHFLENLVAVLWRRSLVVEPPHYGAQA